MGGKGSGGKPKVYPPDLVARVESLYLRGMTQAEIGVELGLTQKIVWNVMRRHDIGARVAAKRYQSGSTNHAWKGGAAGYQALHLRVEAARGKASRCSACDTTDPAIRYEWANLTGRYDLIEDYVRLCVSCHRRLDAHRRAVTGERTSPKRRSA